MKLFLNLALPKYKCIKKTYYSILYIYTERERERERKREREFLSATFDVKIQEVFHLW
jgi:hypothetical protein